MKQFTVHISYVVSLNFNKHVLLEARVNGLRISIIHETYAKSGRSISIRKLPPIKRLYDEMMLKINYIIKMLTFLRIYLYIYECCDMWSNRYFYGFCSLTGEH